MIIGAMKTWILNRHVTGGAAAVCASMLLSGCATEYSDRQITYCMEQSLISAKDHVQQGNMDEAYRLASAMQKVNPSFPGLAEVKTACAPEQDHEVSASLLGSNVRKRAAVKRCLPARIVLYIPDRILDVLDIFSFDLHFGGGILVNAHATRALQVGAGLQSVGGIGWHDNRSLGFEGQKEAALNILAFGPDACSMTRVGTSGIQDVSDGIAFLHTPTKHLYQEYRDYWGVGASVTLLFIGVDVDFHPVQVLDLLGGFVGFDLCSDDFAHTRSLKSNDLDRKLLLDLAMIRKYKGAPADEAAPSVSGK